MRIEIMPLYACKESDICPKTETECFSECHHTSFPLYALHPESVDIFNKFCETFNIVIGDEDGRVYCVENTPGCDAVEEDNNAGDT